MILLHYKRISIKSLSDYTVLYNEKEIASLYECLPPETRTPSALLARAFTMALWPERFCTKSPLGNFHCLMLSGEAEANVYLQDVTFTNIFI